MKRGIRSWEIILCVLVLAVIVAGLFLPKTGSFVMVDEICDVLVVWIVCAYVIVRIARSKGNFPASVKAARGIVVAVCVCIGVWFAWSVVLDLVSGPESVTLSEIQTGKSRPHSVFSQHYYLKGTDSRGETLQMEISGEDYTRLSGCSTVTVAYYRNTGRIAGFQPVSDQAGETQEKRTRDEEQGRIELTQRQKELLEEAGLPTDYDELTDTQKNAITSIESLLTYLEEKYQEEFCYLSYAEAGALEEEHLEAYPKSGTRADVVTVYRTYEDGEYHYEDDYGNIGLKLLYESRVREFASQTFPESGIKIYSDVSSAVQDAEVQNVTEENVLQTLSANTYIFISDSICTKQQFHDFKEKCAQWLGSQCQGAAAQICLRLTDAAQWELIDESDYEDKLREDIYTDEAECAVTASGKVTVY